MNCANHVDAPAVAFCRTCGKPLCSSCVRDVRGVIYCEECLASQLSGTMPPPGTGAVPPGAQPVVGGGSPRLAALLGFIPGVGAMYNGEYAKGFVHVIIFITLIMLTREVHGIFGIAIAAFYLYMPIEAYKTAKAHEMGLPAPDPLGLNSLLRPEGVPAGPIPTVNAVPVAGGARADSSERPPRELEYGGYRVPIGAIILIGLGVLLLLNQFGVFNFDWDRIWPVILIAIGVGVLFKRRRMGM